jgi:beta-lactamase class A
MITVSSTSPNLLIQRWARTSSDRRRPRRRRMIVRRGVDDSKAFAKGLNNPTTARALMVLGAHRQARGGGSDASRRIEVLKRQHFNDAIPANLLAPPRHKTGSITKSTDAAIVARPFVLVVPTGPEDIKRAPFCGAHRRVLYDEAQQDRFRTACGGRITPRAFWAA